MAQELFRSHRLSRSLLLSLDLSLCGLSHLGVIEVQLYRRLSRSWTLKRRTSETGPWMSKSQNDSPLVGTRWRSGIGFIGCFPVLINAPQSFQTTWLTHRSQIPVDFIVISRSPPRRHETRLRVLIALYIASFFLRGFKHKREESKSGLLAYGGLGTRLRMLGTKDSPADHGSRRPLRNN